jgi:hypothetical protein
MLGLLGNYGGPTPTMALLQGSPALGVGAASTNVPTTDQRGVTRGSVIDLGAFQQTTNASAPTTTTLTATTTSTSSGLSVTLTATVTTPGSVTPAGTVQFVDTTTGTTLGNAAVTVVNGQAQATFTGTLSAGNHSITATYQSSNGLGNSSGSTTVSATSPNQTWLQQAYHDILGRNVDPSGLAFWTGLMTNGMTRGEVAYFLLQSTEYHADQIQQAFQTLLQRQADTPSLNYFLGLMGQGATIEQVDAIIAGSDEYFQTRGTESNSGFLSAIYQDFLHRGIDANGLQTWQQVLANGQSRTQVVTDLLNTTEYKNDLVQNAYQTYLHRSPDTTSLNAFTAYLSQGGSDAIMVAFLIGSQEYFNNANATPAA